MSGRGQSETHRRPSAGTRGGGGRPTAASACSTACWAAVPAREVRRRLADDVRRHPERRTLGHQQGERAEEDPLDLPAVGGAGAFHRESRGHVRPPFDGEIERVAQDRRVPVRGAVAAPLLEPLQQLLVHEQGSGIEHEPVVDRIYAQCELVTKGVGPRLQTHRPRVRQRPERPRRVLTAVLVVRRGARRLVEEPRRYPEDVGIGLVDGALVRRRQDELSVIAAQSRGRHEFAAFNLVEEAGLGAGIRLALELEARRSEPTRDRTARQAAPGPLRDGKVRETVHQFVRDGVQRHPRLRRLRVRHPALAEDVDAGALGAERRRNRKGVVEVVVDDADDAPVPAVEPLPPVPLREVVVGPAHVHVAVDHRRVVPEIVGVGPDVARRPALDAKRPPVGQPVEPLDVEARVEGHDFARPEAVAGLVPSALPRRADLLRIAEEPGPGPDGGLRVERRLPPHDGAVGGGYEVGVEVIQGQGIRQLVRAAEQRQDDQVRKKAVCQGRSGPLREEARGLAGGQRRRGLQVDAGVEGAEERDRHAPVELPRHPRAMHPHAFVELCEGTRGSAPAGCDRPGGTRRRARRSATCRRASHPTAAARRHRRRIRPQRKRRPAGAGTPRAGPWPESRPPQGPPP